MCNCDLERPDFWVEETPKARKQHKCAECRHTIEIRETYHRMTGKWDGRVSTTKCCNSCYEIGTKILECWGIGELNDSLWNEDKLGYKEGEGNEEDIVISHDERLEVVSQYPKLKCRMVA